MAITFNIPDKAWVRVQGAAPVDCGTINNAIEKRLRFIKVGFYKHNCTGQFRLRLHTSPDMNSVYAQSNLIDISEIPHDYFYGNIRFDFDRCVLAKGKSYYVSIASSGYTRNGDTSYMSWVHDKPLTTNDTTGNWPIEFPVRMEVFAR